MLWFNTIVVGPMWEDKGVAMPIVMMLMCITLVSATFLICIVQSALNSTSIGCLRIQRKKWPLLHRIHIAYRSIVVAYVPKTFGLTIQLELIGENIMFCH